MPDADIPEPTGSQPSEDEEMADVPVSMHETSLSRLDAVAVLHHEHVNVFSKVLDLMSEERRGLVSLKQSLGVREVTSQSGQQGIPLSGAAAGQR
jgi:hypothetical protein